MSRRRKENQKTKVVVIPSSNHALPPFALSPVLIACESISIAEQSVHLPKKEKKGKGPHDVLLAEYEPPHRFATGFFHQSLAHIVQTQSRTLLCSLHLLCTAPALHVQSNDAVRHPMMGIKSPSRSCPERLNVEMENGKWGKHRQRRNHAAKVLFFILACTSLIGRRAQSRPAADRQDSSPSAAPSTSQTPPASRRRSRW